MRNEIILFVGPPGGGKGTVAKRLGDEGYTVLNRDTIGGGLSRQDALIYQRLRDLHGQGVRSFVLDNTYGTVESRKPAVALATGLDLPVRVQWLATTPEQAQFFAARRQIQRHGKLFRVEDYKAHRSDPNMFPPAAQFAYWKKFQAPTLGEGFTSIERVPVRIDLGPEYTAEAVIFDYDGTLRDGFGEYAPGKERKWPTRPGQVQLLPGRREKVQELAARGIQLLGASNQSGVSRNPGDPRYVSEADCLACFERTNQLLGVDIPVLFAMDRGGVPQTYWRKPAPGMGVVLIEQYKLDPGRCTYVGDRTEDQTFAERCGFKFAWAEDFFA